MLTTQTNREFIEAQYSTFILRNLQDGLLPENFYRNVTDFIKGEVSHIRSIGDSSVQELVEDVAIAFSPIDSGEVTLTITDYAGTGWYVTDIAKQDVAMLEQLVAAKSSSSLRALQEHFETRALATLASGMTQGNPNLVNGFAHNIMASGANDTLELQDILRMKLAFDKAEVPYAGRIAIVDPIVSATLTQKFQGQYNVDSNPVMQEILSSTFSKDHTYIMDFMGFSFISSNRLPAGTFTDGTKTVNGVANLFLSVFDDNTKPMMAAWRQQPTTESSRNHGLKRDEFSLSARWGMAIQRKDTLGLIATSATHIA